MLNSYVYIITLFLYTIRFIITSQKYKINDFLQIISSIFLSTSIPHINQYLHGSGPHTYTAMFGYWHITEADPQVSLCYFE